MTKGLRPHNKPRRRVVRHGVIVGLVVVSCGVAAVAVAANDPDNMVPTNNGGCGYGWNGESGDLPQCQTDNAVVWYYMDSYDASKLEPEDKAAVNSAMYYDFGTTDLTTSLDTSPTFEGPGETDIVYQESYTNLGGLAGLAWCNDTSSGTQWDCDQQYVRIRPGGYQNSGLVCHETGHAVGLTHGPNADPYTADEDPVLGCMRRPAVDGRTLGSNNRANINVTY